MTRRAQVHVYLRPKLVLPEKLLSSEQRNELTHYKQHLKSTKIVRHRSKYANTALTALVTQ
jgi:hypothetical protein